MPKNGACCLSSINLSEYVNNPFSDKCEFDYDSLHNDVFDIVQAMDDLIDENILNHPLKEQQEVSRTYRNIGIGIMGLADCLVKLKLKYGSNKAIDFTRKLINFIFRNAVYASVQLGLKRGNFPGYTSKVWDSNIIKNNFTDEEIEELKKTDHLRNCSLLSIAPNGTISTFLNISGGTEPFFALSYKRKTESLNGNDQVKYYDVDVETVKLYKQIFADWPQVQNNNPLPDYFVTAGDISYINRVHMQSALQSAVDTAISSTVNMRKETTYDDVEKLYLEAWKAGLKGITIYVDGSRDPILSTSTSKPKEEVKQPIQKFNYIQPISRKQIGTTYGATYSKQSSCGRLYITINKDDKGNIVELFTHTSKGGICQANLNALTRSVSLNLRSGVVLSEIIDQLKGIYCPACAALKAKGKKVDGLSCPDILSKTLADFVNQKNSNDKDKDKEIPIKIEKKIIEDIKEETTPFSICPECGEKLNHNGGCVSCTNCGFSKCD